MTYIPEFIITPHLLAEVEQVAVLRERIQSAVVDLAWIPALQKDTRTRNGHASTAIEGNPLTLDFNQFELLALAAGVGIAGLVSLDGESNWLEGAQLLALYAIVALAFFFLPTLGPGL